MTAAARLMLALVVWIAPQAAMAHPVFGGATGFYGGLLHPLLVPAHAMAVVAIGVLMAQQQSKWRWRTHWPAPVAFVGGLVIGTMAIANAYAPTYSNEAILACAALAGGLLALAIPLARWVVAILAAAGGAAVALDSPPDVISIREAVVIQLGTFCGASVFLLCVIEITTRLDRQWQRIGVRILGSWIAASAVLVLTLRLVK
jgi:urease accessory protein